MNKKTPLSELRTGLDFGLDYSIGNPSLSRSPL
jgi:hypothetical protein